MKKLSVVLAFVLIGSGLMLNAQEKKKSPAQTVKGKIGETTITINYSAPSVRERAVFGELEKFGKVWRAGANEATTIEFSADVKINGMKLKAGKYAFFTTPTEEGSWPIFFNSEHKQWGAYKLDATKNVVESEAAASKIEHTEMLTYSISDGMIHLSWATTRISFNVE